MAEQTSSKAPQDLLDAGKVLQETSKTDDAVVAQDQRYEHLLQALWSLVQDTPTSHS